MLQSPSLNLQTRVCSHICRCRFVCKQWSTASGTAFTEAANKSSTTCKSSAETHRLLLGPTKHSSNARAHSKRRSTLSSQTKTSPPRWRTGTKKLKQPKLRPDLYTQLMSHRGSWHPAPVPGAAPQALPLARKQSWQRFQRRAFGKTARVRVWRCSTERMGTL